MTYSVGDKLRQPNRMVHEFKSPKRITITLPHNAYESLLKKSDWEGRSLSNLAAFLLESALEKLEDT